MVGYPYTRAKVIGISTLFAWGNDAHELLLYTSDTTYLQVRGQS